MSKSKRDDALDAAQEALKKGRRRAKRQEQAEDTRPSSAELFPDLLTNLDDFALFAWIKKRLGFLGKLGSVLNVIWNEWLGPLARFLNPYFQRLWHLYLRIFDKFAHINQPDGERKFSQRRAAGVALALLAFSIFMPIFIVRTVIPETLTAIYDASMLLSLEEDHLYLSRADLIDADRELYQVMGCRDIAGCDGGVNTIYYRLRPNFILNVKYWFTLFEPYDPAEIAGAMVSELNDCTISYYGRRVKALGWFPYIINASCRPYQSIEDQPDVNSSR